MVNKVETDRFDSLGCFTSLSGHAGKAVRPDNARSGLTLVELIVVLAVIGILATMAMPVFTEYMALTKKSACASDLHTIDKTITAYAIDNGNVLPASLSDTGMGELLDPWKHPYEYQIVNVAINPAATPLEDLFGGVLNADYDLYSKGENGLSFPEFGHNEENKDDIVRATNLAGNVYFDYRP